MRFGMRNTTVVGISLLFMVTGSVFAWKLHQTNKQLTSTKSENSSLRTTLRKLNEVAPKDTDDSASDSSTNNSVCLGSSPKFPQDVVSAFANRDSMILDNMKVIFRGQLPKDWNVSANGEPLAFKYDEEGYLGPPGCSYTDIAVLRARRPDWPLCHSGACDGGGADIQIYYIEEASMKSYLAKNYSVGEDNGTKWETMRIDDRNVKVSTVTDEGKETGETNYYFEDLGIQIRANRGDSRVKSTIDHFINTLNF